MSKNDIIDERVSTARAILNGVFRVNPRLRNIGKSFQRFLNDYFNNQGSDILKCSMKKISLNNFTDEELYHFMQMIEADVFNYLNLYRVSNKGISFVMHTAQNLKYCNEMK